MLDTRITRAIDRIMFELDLIQASMQAVAEALQQGKTTSEELVGAYLGISCADGKGLRDEC